MTLSSPVALASEALVDTAVRLVPSEAGDAQKALDVLLYELSPAQRRSMNDYSTLSKQIKEEGLLNRTIGFYIRKFITITLLVGLTWLGIFLLRDNAYILLLSPILGLLTAQYGFLAHESAHQQVFTSPTHNKKVGILLADGFAGLAYGWWMVKHSKHHANPNQVKKDPDVEIKVLSFTAASLNEKKGIEGWLARRQGWLFIPLLTFSAFYLLSDSVQTLFTSKSKVQHRGTEISLLLGRQIIFPVILVLMMPSLWLAAGFWLSSMLFFGFFMGAAFAPNHKGMPIIPQDAKIDFLRRQVLTSRNINGGWAMDNLMGGLNYQVEHHLFPSMPRPHLRRAAEITKTYCAEHKIPYYQTSLIDSYLVAIRYLNKVGLAAADPFDCPMANQLRMGMPAK